MFVAKRQDRKTKPSRRARKDPSDETLATAGVSLGSPTAAGDNDVNIPVGDLARAHSDFRNLLEATRIAAIFLDNDLRVRSFTPTATEAFHLLDSDVGRPIEHLGSRVDYPDLSDDVRKVLTKLGSIERDISSKDGRSYIARVLPYRSIDNFIAGAVLTFVDVTSTVKAESALRESEARLRTLLAELQHRVRNTLAVVQSITRRTADSSTSVEEMAAHLSGRLDAFARVQAAVTRNPDAGVDLRSLLDDELLVHATHEGDGLAVDGPDVSLRPKAAESVSLALHELTTNAVKHGVLGMKDGGVIAISWRLDGDGHRGGRDLRFEWTEKSSNGRIPKPERHGFGMELLSRILPYDLGAKTNVEFGQKGLRFQMELPTEHIVETNDR
jgi:two-component system CheB/CheR fusion protein